MHVIFKGNVQGVGFRYTARSIAQRYSITGYVKNLTSGAVEVVAEGTEAQLAAFADEIGREMGGCIETRTVHWNQPTGEFLAFSVRF
jgi:acylphosphatase